MDESILVVGSNGLLGASCIALLGKDENKKIVGLWNNNKDRINTGFPRVAYERGDLLDRASLAEIFRRHKITQVVHTGVALPTGNMNNYFERAISVNILGTANLLECAKEYACRRFIYCSSVGVYGVSHAPEVEFSESMHPSPIDIYGWSKSAAENYLQIRCQSGDMQAVVLRLSGLHGEQRASGVFYSMIQSVRAKRPLYIASAKTPFQYLALTDAVSYIGKILDDRLSGVGEVKVLNVASETIASLNVLAESIRHKLNENVEIVTASGDSSTSQVMTTTKLIAELGLPICDRFCVIEQICQALMRSDVSV